MSINNWGKLLGTILIGAAPMPLLANGMRLVSQDGFASARGEAFVATADNPSAIYYNPAGITQLEGFHLRGTLYGLYFDPTFSPTNGAANDGRTYDIETKLAAAASSFCTYSPSNLPASFGLGIYAPYGGSISWPQDTGFRTVAIEGSLLYLTINPVASLKLPYRISIGGGVMVNYANLESEQGLRPSYAQPGSTFWNTNFFRFEGEGWSVGYNLGLLWQPLDQVSFGATFRSTATVTLSGNTHYQQYSAAIPYTSLPAEMDLKFPWTMVFGVSYRPTPRWNLEFNADYTDWTSFGETTLHQLEPTTLGGEQNPSVKYYWEASWIFSFGATHYLDHGWHISAGYLFNENSVPDDYYMPTVADLDRHFFSFGFGRKGKTIDFDVTYQFGYGPDRTVNDSRFAGGLGQN
jgi:long-chain fatty acid transport protein